MATKQAAVLGRDAILRTDALKRRTVTVEQLGGDVLVREMTGMEAAHFQKRSLDLVNNSTGRIKSAKALANLNASVVICGVINEDGTPVFRSEDTDLLMGLPSSVVDAIADAVLDISGMSASGRRRAEKNFVKTLSDDSGSG